MGNHKMFVFQRRRHLWRLDAKSVTLFVDEKSSRYYKVNLLTIFFLLLLMDGSDDKIL